ncbi:MAG: hypothetical protein U0892_01855 [Pirellulales bacterium]
MRLVSHVDESLVVKLLGSGAGLTAGGQFLDITDRIGGSVQIEGAPGFPVVLTSLKDDTVGAGFTPDGLPQLDTNGDGSATQASLGDWRSVRFDPDSNDRNVDVVPERETDQIQDTGTNDDVYSAQPIGGLASSLGAGDENLRLGMTVYGSIASNRDRDVYSFVGTAGSAVWLDIDRTASGLDSVVELLGADGTILALSDNSLDESLAATQNTTSTLYQTPNTTRVAPNQVQVMERDPFAQQNSWYAGVAKDEGSINPKDAGFRLVLPGTVGTSGTFYVRVRSNNLSPGDPTSKLIDPAYETAGLSKGSYRLQVRLQQTDEMAGSAVKYADMRFATNGVEGLASPFHSPLTNTVTTGVNSNVPVPLGNVGISDRGVVSVSGSLSRTSPIGNNTADVAWYTFSLTRADIQQIASQSGQAPAGTNISVTLDVDYTDGFGGPNTSLWLYNSANELIYVGTDSNIADDQPAPTRGSNIDDLTRGSTDKRDSLIGPIPLPAGGGTFRLAVTSNLRIMEPMAQYQEADADAGGSGSSSVTATSTRMEPIASVQRIVEDRFETGTPNYPSTATGPISVAFGPDQSAVQTNNQVAYTLADIPTYIVDTSATVKNINAFTGALESTVSRRGLGNSTNLGDVDIKANGRVVGSFVGFTNQADTTATIAELDDAGNGGALSGATSGLITYTTQTTGTTTAVQQRNGTGDGIAFNGLAFSNDGTTELAVGVGSRGNGQTNFRQPTFDANNNVNGISGVINYNTTNIVYALNAANYSVIRAQGTTDRTTPQAETQGAGTNLQELGRFLSGSAASNYTNGVVTGLARIGSQLYGVSNLGEFYSVNIGGGTGNQFASDLVVNNATTTYYGTLPTRTLNDGGLPIAFTGLTKAPDDLIDGDGNAYTNVLIGITANGTMYAFDTTGNPMNIFPGGVNKTKSNTVGRTVTGVSGIAFSPLDVNLWHISNIESSNGGHGYPTNAKSATASPDNIRPRAEATDQNVLSFGFENYQNNSRQDGTWGALSTGFDNSLAFPGGAEGAIESLPMDLSSYSADDLPTLYFNYHLDTENANAGNSGDTNYMKDAFRVYGTKDNGTTWVLLATNNSARTADYSDGQDEFDPSINGDTDAYGSYRYAQELYDVGDNNAPDAWRQARVNLSALAGGDAVKLRFEFSTAGSFKTGDVLSGGVELTAVPGYKLGDGQTFQVASNDVIPAVTKTFEFDLGYVLNMPGGSSIPIGSTITIDSRTYTFAAAAGANRFVVSATDSPADVAAKIVAKLQADGYDAYTNVKKPNVVVLPTNATNVRNVSAGGVYTATGINTTDLIQGRPGTGTNVSIPIRQDVLDYVTAATDVRDAMKTAFATALSNGVTGVWTTYGQTVRLVKYDVTLNGALPGLLGLTSTTSRPGDAFGADSTAAINQLGTGAAVRGQNNTGFGVRIDDIIVGFAERGEQVWNAPVTTGVSPTQNRDHSPAGLQADETDYGKFQLEVRTSADFGVSKDVPGSTNPKTSYYSLSETLDTNYRFTPSIGLQIPAAAAIADGTTFTLSDGTTVVTFEFDVTNGTNDVLAAGTQSGHVPIVIAADDYDYVVARKVRDAINSAATQTQIIVDAEVVGENHSLGNTSTGTVVNLFGNVSITRIGNTLPVGSPLSVVSYGADTEAYENAGDSNRGRVDQGQLIISSSTFRDSSQYGVKLDDTPASRGSRLFPTINAANQTVGTVVMNNIFDRNRTGGVSVDSWTPPALSVLQTEIIAASPAVRIVNNTFYGGGSGNGVRIGTGPTPTVLNNIFSSESVGVAGPGSSVLGGNLYQNNGTNVSGGVLGTFDKALTPADPLFVNPIVHNFYLAAGAYAIDSSIEALPESLSVSQLRNSLSLPPSPILAPDRDCRSATCR